MGIDIPQEVRSNDTEFKEESWEWDGGHKSPEVSLSNDSKAAYFHTDPVDGSKGTAGVRGSRGFQEGEHYWEVKFLEPAMGSSVMIGVGTREAVLHTEGYKYVDLLGKDQHSWGLSYKGTVWHAGKSRRFCDPFFDANTVIGIHLNLYKGTLTYYKNGQKLGVAFTGIQPQNQELYPMISSTATNSELELGATYCRYLSLEQKCYHVLAASLRPGASPDLLPLPTVLKNRVLEFQ